MAKDRYYGSGAEKALFMLSRGTCYEPSCKSPVLRMANTGTPRVNVQIAHIYALGRGEARYDESYPRDKLNTFENLLLLCQPHHTEVDSELWTEYYQAEVLIEWKRKREGRLSDDLSSLPPLFSDNEFERVMVSTVTHLHENLSEAIDKVAGISQSTLELLQSLVNESFMRPYLTEEDVASLEYSARIFHGMGDQTAMLYESSRSIRNMEDPVYVLSDSIQRLGEISDYAAAVRGLNLPSPESLENFATAANKLDVIYNLIDLFNVASGQFEAARLPELHTRIEQIEYAIGLLASNVANAGSVEKSISAAAVRAESAEDASGSPGYWDAWPWDSFRWGMGASFLSVVLLLVLWTIAVKHR